MTSAQVVKTSVTVNNNSPIQDYVHLDDHNSAEIWNDSWVQTFHRAISVKDNSGVYAEQSVFLSDMLVIIISIRMQFKS